MKNIRDLEFRQKASLFRCLDEYAMYTANDSPQELMNIRMDSIRRYAAQLECLDSSNELSGLEKSAVMLSLENDLFAQIFHSVYWESMSASYKRSDEKISVIATLLNPIHHFHLSHLPVREKLQESGWLDKLAKSEYSQLLKNDPMSNLKRHLSFGFYVLNCFAWVYTHFSKELSAFKHQIYSGIAIEYLSKGHSYKKIINDSDIYPSFLDNIKGNYEWAYIENAGLIESLYKGKWTSESLRSAGFDVEKLMEAINTWAPSMRLRFLSAYAYLKVVEQLAHDLPEAIRKKYESEAHHSVANALGMKLSRKASSPDLVKKAVSQIIESPYLDELSKIPAYIRAHEFGLDLPPCPIAERDQRKVLAMLKEISKKDGELTMKLLNKLGLEYAGKVASRLKRNAIQTDLEI